MSRVIKQQTTVFNQEVASTESSAIDVRDFRNTMITVIADSSYAGTLQVFASFSDEKPDLSVAASSTNEYWAVELKNRNNDASIPGTTGVVFTGAEDGITGYATNTDGVQWIGFKTSSVTAGNVTVKVNACDNQ